MIGVLPAVRIPVFALEGMVGEDGVLSPGCFAPDLERKLNDLAVLSGCGSADALVQDVAGGYFDEACEDARNASVVSSK